MGSALLNTHKIRFAWGWTFRGLHGSHLLRPVDLLASLANPTRPCGRADGDVYFQASDGSVTLPAAGYKYGDNWAIFTGGTFTHWNGS